ncbi:uncharacterized protein BO97DRAFT_439817, partial [Aspergillus homomorphus CBS 101889]
LLCGTGLVVVVVVLLLLLLSKLLYLYHHPSSLLHAHSSSAGLSQPKRIWRNAGSINHKTTKHDVRQASGSSWYRSW